MRSKIAQYIAGEVKLEELIDRHRISVPVQKRFMFDDTWITMNREIGEAVISSAGGGGAGGSLEPPPAAPKRWRPSAIQERRRNAVAVTDARLRLMTNGGRWPDEEDWVVSADRKIRYGPMLRPLRPLGRDEWPGPEAAQEPSAPPLPEQPAPVSGSHVSDRTYRTYGHLTPASYDAGAYMDSTS